MYAIHYSMVFVRLTTMRQGHIAEMLRALFIPLIRIRLRNGCLCDSIFELVKRGHA